MNGNTSRAEGIKMSKDLAEHYLYWLRTSPYGKKNTDLPLYMLIKASFFWGIERQLDPKLKVELDTLKTTINKPVKESIDTKYWEDYNTDTSGQGKKEFANKSKDFEDTYKHQSNTSCYFIAQDDNDVPEVNSGFWMIRNTSWSLQFVDEWIKSTLSPPNDQHWDYDQGPLLNAIMRFTGKTEGNHYNDHCFSEQPFTQRNLCWYKTMRKYGYKDHNKKIDHICLISNHLGMPLRFHSHNTPRKITELVLHTGLQKKVNINLVYPGILGYDKLKRSPLYPDGMLIQQPGARSIYMTENGTRRGFTGADSFLKRGFEWDNVTLISEFVMKKIPIGPDLT